MNRRFFLSVAGAIIACLPAQAQQQGRRYRVGVLMGNRDPEVLRLGTVLVGELGRLGFVEGRNLEVRFSYAPGDLTARARDLIAFQPDVIIAGGTLPTRVLQSLTPTIPIVFLAADPVAGRLVKNLARPGGHTTGVSTLICELVPKLMELLRELGARRVVLVTTPLDGHPCKAAIEALRSEVKAIVPVKDDQALTIQAVLRENPDAILDQGLPPEVAVTLASSHRIPIASVGKGPGVLVSIERDRDQVVLRHAALVAKILNGANPGELPVEFPREFRIVVDLHLAKEIGIRVPDSILLRADRVIE